VLKLRVGEESVLLTGDLEDEGEARLLARAGAGELAATVLKVPHHGSARACTDALLDAVHPRIAIVSCGHPPPAITAARLARSAACTYRTDQLGALRLRLGREIAVERWCGRWVPIE
jgi:competence protein ComEC